jgi:excisionase family DNA binding protein
MTSQRSQAVAALERAPDDAVAAVLALLEAYGPEPTAQAVSDAAAWNTAISAERRRLLIERSVTREQAAEILDVTAQAVSSMLRRGGLAGFKVGREWRLPRWQFDPDSDSGLLSGLRDVLAGYPGSVVGLSRWIETESPDLDGLTPRMALQRGRVGEVLVLIRALSA